MTRNLYALFLAAILLLSILTGCGGSSPSSQQPPPPPRISVSVSPKTVSLSSGAIQQFTATVTGTSATAVTWSLSGCSGAACGTIDTNGLYTAPSPIPSAATVTVEATLQSDSSKTDSATVNLAPPPLNAGDYAFVFNGWKGQGGGTFTRLVIIGQFHTDGSGNITAGVEDINDASGVSLSLPLTGTYQADSTYHNGWFILVSPQDTTQYVMTFDPTGTKGNFIRDGTNASGLPVSGSGFFELQDSSAFSSSALAGSYALQFTAKPDDSQTMAAVGSFTVDAGGTLSNGEMDMLAPAGAYSQLALGGTVDAPSSNGRGTANLTLNPAPGAFLGSMQFVYYVISASKVVVMQTDARGAAVPVLSGEAQRQAGTMSLATFNAPAIFDLGGAHSVYQSAVIGQMTPDGAGSMTGIFDQNFESNAVLNQSFNGTYTLDSQGRSTLDMLGGSAVAYFYGPNLAYMMQQPSSDILYGNLKPQSAGPFSPASLSTLRISEADPVSPFAESDMGTITFDGVSSFSLGQSYEFFYSDGTYVEYHGQFLNGSYTLDANGRGVISINGFVLPFWLVSPDEVTVVDTATNGVDYLPVVQHLLK